MRSIPASAAVAIIVLTAAAPALAAPIKVACIGEQTTHSDAFPANNRESQPVDKQEYPAKLQTLLGAGYDVRNFGDCCGTVLQGYTPSETHPYVLGSLSGRGPGYKESLTFLPDIVVIGSWGRHDWGKAKLGSVTFDLTKFQKDYDDLVQRYQALASHPKIYVSLPIPILFGQGDVPDNGVTTSSVLPAVRAVAAKYNLPVIDLYTAFLGHKELFKMPPTEGEGEHVTDGPGLQTIADTVYAALTTTDDAGVDDAGSDGAADGDAPSPLDASANADARSTNDGAAVSEAQATDAGEPAADGAGDELAASAATGDTSGCSCSTSGRGGPSTPLALVMATAAALCATWRRRRLT